jgi:hypothetical protein
MLIKGIKCVKCMDVLYSRARHDMRFCSCGSAAIDGGFDYIKVTGEPEFIEDCEVNVLDGADKNEVVKTLYDDWKNKTDKFGRLPG